MKVQKVSSMNEDLEEVTAKVPRPLVIDLGTYTTKIGFAP